VTVFHGANCLCGLCRARRRGDARRDDVEQARRLRELAVLCGCGCGERVVPGAELRAYVNAAHKQRAYRRRRRRAVSS
jgi:cytidylate kinase